MARTVEDVLARRTRLLFLDARAALAKAPQVARELARELRRDEAWLQSQIKDFARTANHFIPLAS
jgi:glycerol-3-phosphate dehydrogenase